MNHHTLPAQYRAAFQSIQELEPATLIAQRVVGKTRVLNVGPSWGRDFYMLTQCGHRVFNLDVALQTHLPQTIQANVASAIPFADQTFDAVLLPEVLEHIWNDFDALQQARRVLKDDGCLIVSVPFYNDAPDYHIRIHSPKSIVRLLRANGFEPTDYIERGGWVSFPRVAHGLRKLFRLIGRAESWMSFAVRCDKWLGRQKFFGLRWLQGYGCIISARKSAATDFEKLNAIEFRHG